MSTGENGFGSSAPDGPPCSATGLKPKQKQAIVDSWAVVCKNKKQNGVDLFIAFFKAYPDYQNKFELFRGVSLEELRTTAKLRAHAASVMFSISSIVNSLDDPECLVELIKKTANNHYTRTIRPFHFEDLKGVILDVFASKLGASFDDLTRGAWDAVLTVMNKVVADTMAERDKQS